VGLSGRGPVSLAQVVKPTDNVRIDGVGR
jgi:hypothetical protein